MVDRTPREQTDRKAEERPASWTPPRLLPTPEPREGMAFRWVRTSMVGNGDNVNVSAKFREHWTPVKASEFPELHVMSDLGSRFPENIEVGGLLLCQRPKALSEQRSEYYQRRANQQIEAVDNDFMRDSNPVMPVLKPERTSRISRFGTD